MKRIIFMFVIILSLLVINLACGPETYAVPRLVSPANGAVITENPPTFIWTSVEDPNLYCLEVSRDSSFTTVYFEVTCSADTNYTPENVLDSGTFFWHVRTIEGG